MLLAAGSTVSKLVCSRANDFLIAFVLDFLFHSAIVKQPISGKKRLHFVSLHGTRSLYTLCEPLSVPQSSEGPSYGCSESVAKFRVPQKPRAQQHTRLCSDIFETRTFFKDFSNFPSRCRWTEQVSFGQVRCGACRPVSLIWDTLRQSVQGRWGKTCIWVQLFFKRGK